MVYFHQKRLTLGVLSLDMLTMIVVLQLLYTVTPITRLICVLADFIEASQIPPKCGPTGGINFYVTI